MGRRGAGGHWLLIGRVAATALRPGLAFVLAGLLVACATRSLENRDWVAIHSKHFEVVSSLGRDDTLQLVRDAERFHAAVEWMIGTALPAPSAPTRIYAFDGRGFSRPFDRRGEPGYFLPTLQGAVIVLRTGDAWEQDATEGVLHEYVHYLIRTRGGFEQPLWFDEGSADFASTVSVEGSFVDIGKLRRDYIRIMRDQPWMSLTEVLNVYEIEEWGPRRQRIFAAEAWAFVHYLNFGFERPGEGQKRLSDYFERVEKGASTASAIEGAFGMSKFALDKKLHKYSRAERVGSVGVRIPGHQIDEPPEVRPLGEAEVALRLGWLALALDRTEPALKYYELALTRDPGSARAYTGLGVVDTLRGRWQPAMEQFGRALGAAPEDALVQLEIGNYYHGRAIVTSDATERASFAALARKHYLKCAQIDGTIPEAVAMYGATFLLEGEDAKRAQKPLERASQMLPASAEIRLLQARFYSQTGRRRAGRRIAVGVYSRSHDPATRRAAEVLMAETGRAEVLRTQGPVREPR